MNLPPPPDLPPPQPGTLISGPADRPRVRWGIGDFFLVNAPLFVLMGLGLAAVAAGASTKGVQVSAWAIVISVIIQDGYLVGACVGIVHWKGTGSLRDFGLDWAVRARDLLWLLVGAALQIAASLALLPVERALGKSESQSVVSGLEGSLSVGLVIAAILVATAAPFTEELVFRGLFQRSLLRRMRPAGAVAISATVFGVFHLLGDPGLGTLVALPVLIAVGAVCGIRAVRTGDLTQSIFVHVGFNGVTAIALLVAALTLSSVQITVDGARCDVEARKLDPGARVFSVHNEGSGPADVAVRTGRGATVNHVDGVKPGTTRDLEVKLDAGTYEVVCRSADNPDGTRVTLTVRG